jgi:DNA-binding MarR family transcriptional regulator
MTETAHDGDPAEARLALALKHLRARLREESGAGSIGLSTSQVSVLGRLRLGGPATAAALAAAEHVSQQAIAQSVAPLKATGLVAVEPDPMDRRKVLMSITSTGLAMRESVIASRDSWLARAIGITLEPGEWAALEQVIDLLERLADAEPGTQ